MGVAFGLSAAVLWGLGDFTAALASRRSGSLRVVIAFHVISVGILGVLAAATGAIDDVPPTAVPPFLWVGAVGAVSYVAFYKALELGPISIVSPIVSAYAAVVFALAVIVLGERPSAGQLAATAVVLGGVVLASADLAQIHRIERHQALGLLLALGTVFSIGGFVFGYAYYARDYGWLMSLFLSRGFAMLLLVAAAPREARALAGASPRWLGLTGFVAIVDSAGYAMFNLGVERAPTSIVAAASAPYALIPIAAGLLVFRESLNPTQWLGVASVIGGVVLLGLLS